jgi:hypothetical protein
MKIAFFIALLTSISVFAENQTPDFSQIHSQDELPFTVEIGIADFSLPTGLHSYASGMHEDKWIFIGGRTNGVHGFGPSDNNFPKQKQNRACLVVDLKTKKSYIRSFDDPMSGLNEDEIDSLSVTTAQSYQEKGKLYITGGYGVCTKTGKFSTKDTLTVIDMHGLMHWVMHPESSHKASDSIRQIKNELFRITGGYMNRVDNKPTLLIFGQNFSGFYHDETSVGQYSNQIRPFYIHDKGEKLHVHIKDPKPKTVNPAFRRRDLNIVPIMRHKDGKVKEGFVAYSGVFTESDGIWTVPVEIGSKGHPRMANPTDPNTFKQAMSTYSCATAGLFSVETNDMYTLFFGGISYGYYENGTLLFDPMVRFINQITTIKRSEDGRHTQYLMDATFPHIESTQSNPGNSLLFGTNAAFFPLEEVDVAQYLSGILKLDDIKKERTLIGYIVGGIQSTLPNTIKMSDSAASPYIFTVYITKK